MAKAPDKKDGKAMTKGEILSDLAQATNLTKKDVQAVFDALGDLIKKNLGKKGPLVFTIPGLIKLRSIHKPAQKPMQKLNPFTKEMMMTKPKPARNVVKATPLKALKEMVN